jgi:hypothetical protein
MGDNGDDGDFAVGAATDGTSESTSRARVDDGGIAASSATGSASESMSRVSSLDSYKNQLRREIAVLQTTLTVKQGILKDLESIGGTDQWCANHIVAEFAAVVADQRR